MVLLAALASLVGLSLGALGSGGSILTVPLLTYLGGLEAKSAIATSLLVVGAVSIVAMIPHARAGRILWGTAFRFAGAAMVGGYLGGRAAAWFEGKTLLVLFAGMMLLTATMMIRGNQNADLNPKQASGMLIVVEGLVVGAVTGLVGAGGGFLVVPALVLLGGVDVHRAIGTSLVVVALKSFAAFAGHVGHVEVPLGLAAIVTAAAAVGAIVGSQVSAAVPPAKLKQGFGVFVLLAGVFILYRELLA